MSGGTKGTTSTSSSEPWADSQPYLNKTMQTADWWLNDPNSSSQQIYQGLRVVPFSDQTTMGNYLQEDFAGGAGTNMRAQAWNQIGAGGFNSQQNAAMNSMGNFAQGNANQSSAGQNLSGMASGSLLGQGNPYLQQALAAANERAATGINDAMSTAGRYGSGVHQSTLAKTLADQNTAAMFGQYNQDVANMMGANQMIDATNQSNLNRQLSAAGNLFNAGQAGLQNMGTAYKLGQMPATDYQQVGQSVEDKWKQYYQAEMDKFYEQRDRPIESAAQANAIFTGAGQLGQSNTSNVYNATDWTKIGANAAGSAIAGKG
jgi:hypothetical protein